MAVDKFPGSSEPLVALTFDDGPSEWTDPILDHLARHEGRATFFVLGNAIVGEDRIRTLQRLVDEGHEIGNHTFSHAGDLAQRTDAEIEAELQRTTALVEEVASTFRIPISRVRCSVVNITNPNNPRQEMKMARKAK